MLPSCGALVLVPRARGETQGQGVSPASTPGWEDSAGVEINLLRKGKGAPRPAPPGERPLTLTGAARRCLKGEARSIRPWRSHADDPTSLQG